MTDFVPAFSVHATAHGDWLSPVAAVRSPNCDARPAGAELTLTVVHGISLPAGCFGGGHAHALFTNQLDCAAHPTFADLEGLRVSSHLLVDRDGAVTQFVPFDLRAWHAGASSWRGVERCNDFSIGIELEGADDVPYEGAQYHALAGAVRALRQAYPGLAGTGLAGLVGHSDIAPGRKTDPGPAFDWGRLRTLIDA